MTSIAALTQPYAEVMLAPRHGHGVCDICLNLTRGYERCFACTSIPSLLDVRRADLLQRGRTGSSTMRWRATSGAGGPRCAGGYMRGLAAILGRFLELHGALHRSGGCRSAPVRHRRDCAIEAVASGTSIIRCAAIAGELVGSDSETP